MDWLIIIFLVALLITFKWLKIGDTFSPWMITGAVWLGIMVLFQLSGDLLYPLQDRFYTCLLIWIPVMSATGIITYYAFSPANETPGFNGIMQQETKIDSDIQLNEKIYTLFFITSLIFTPLYVYQIYKVIVMFGSEDLLFNLRVLANAGEKDLVQTLLTYINAVNQALFIIEMWRYPKGSKFRLTVIVIANLMCAFAIMEKGALFFLLFVTLFILYEKKKVKMGSIIFWGIAIIFIFYGINEMRTSDNNKDETTLLDFFGMYILSPGVAFETVQEKLTDQFGSRSFAFFYAVVSRLGLVDGVVVEPKLQEFVQVPILTNIYTIFQPFYEDFGYKGIGFFASVYGVFTGWLYRQCHNGGAISKCIYAYIVEILVLQFYQENLILSLSMLFQYLFVFMFSLQQRFKISFKTEKE